MTTYRERLKAGVHDAKKVAQKQEREQAKADKQAGGVFQVPEPKKKT